MISKLRSGLLALLAVVLAGYLAVVGYLFVEQRRMLFVPSGIPLGAPPTRSGYEPLTVQVPSLGVIEDWWAPPASRIMPTVVFFHGNGADRAEFMDLGARLHDRGWGVVLASYRGYSGNPGKPTETGLMADARATLAAVAPRVGPVIVWGHSLGSGVAARVAAEGRVAGLVLESPYTSVTDVAARLYPYIPVRLLLLDRFDTRALTARIHVPVLIFHSVDDPQIPFAMGQELADRLGPLATFVRLNGVGHDPHLLDLSPTVVRWADDRRIGG